MVCSTAPKVVNAFPARNDAMDNGTVPMARMKCYATDYEEETPADEEKPSFPMLPMLAMTVPPPPPTRVTAPPTPRAPPRVAPSKTPSASSGTFSKRVKPVVETTTRAEVELVTTTVRPTTKPSPRTTAPVRPRNEASKQLFAQPSSSEEKSAGVETTTLPAVVHEVKVSTGPLDSQSSDNADPRAKLLKRLGAQLNGRMSPELLSKLEDLLASDMVTTVRKATSSGIATESSALVSRTAPVTSTALVRRFTSRVRNNERVQNE
ncbi:hypothetical protein Y032_0591g395 [Ancylostoma ceylanicum]|uniref:Uncharacterized protein n=1 Tax=Ancylostoma ceylanicum TaxID=53326 RepID=A0A016WMP8_9BILA|nr:hypothetical protein Y032_0591g395 [Ancylostoma ceylanicum]